MGKANREDPPELPGVWQPPKPPGFGRGHRDELPETPKTPASREQPGWSPRGPLPGARRGTGGWGGRIIYSKIRGGKATTSSKRPGMAQERGEHPNIPISPPQGGLRTEAAPLRGC